MKKFLYNILIFGVLVLFFFLTVFYLGTSIIRASFSYPKLKGKNILLVGDSHIESAIDDKIVKNTANLGQSGKSYFYSYLKVREITEINPQIDTIVISYSYHNLYTDWLTDDRFYVASIQDYLSLMKHEDLAFLFNKNPSAVIKFLPKAIFKNFIRLSKNSPPSIGNYIHLDRDKLEDNIELEEQKNESPIYYIEEEIKYLKKIHKFCQDNDLTLLLLNVPIHPYIENKWKTSKDKYCSFVDDNLPDATLINHSNFSLLDSMYADLEHLNFKGARVYSNFYNKMVFVAAFKDVKND